MARPTRGTRADPRDASHALELHNRGKLFRETRRNFQGLNGVTMSMSLRHAAFCLFLNVSVLGQQATAPPASAAVPALTQEQIQELIRKTADNDMENDKKLRDYTYIQREEQHKLDGKGQVKSVEIKTSEILEIYGEQVERLISKDDKPLPEKEAKKEDEKIQKLIDKRKNESDDERRKRQAKEEKEREEDHKFVLEVADAYNFRYDGVETLDGRETYVIGGEPKPGYEPHLKQAKILPKFRFRAWIDKDEDEWKKLDIQCIDTVSFGLFIARIHKGSRVIIEQTRVNQEVWLPQHISVKVDVRVALVKDFNLNDDITYRDYKKFRSATKIIPLGEAGEQK